jgi:hypothetical protein
MIAKAKEAKAGPSFAFWLVSLTVAGSFLKIQESYIGKGKARRRTIRPSWRGPRSTSTSI